MDVVAAQLPSLDVGANGSFVTASILDNIQAVQSSLSISNEEEKATKYHKKKNAHFAIASWSTGGEAPVPIMVLCPKLTLTSVTTKRYAGPGGYIILFGGA